MTRRRAAVAAVALAAILVLGVVAVIQDGDDGDATAAPAPGTTEAPPTSTPSDDGDTSDPSTTQPPTTRPGSDPGTADPPGTEIPAFDWYAVDDVDLGGGWHLVDCEGDAPIVCITRDGVHAGLVEIAVYPVDSLPEVRDALDEGEEQALRAHVADYLESFRTDREASCGDGEGYAFVEERTRLGQASDGMIVSYGFRGGPRDEPATERTLQWAGIRGDDLVLLNVSAYDDGACLDNNGSEATTRGLAEVAPRLDAAVRSNGLPEPVAA